MGVKTALAAITLTAGDKTQAELIGSDVVGLMALADLKCRELITLLNFISADIMTPGGDSSNATTLGTQVTALS